jgi:hypothetical protein
MKIKNKAFLLSILATGLGWLAVNEIGWQIQKLFPRGSGVFDTIGGIRACIDVLTVFAWLLVFRFMDDWLWRREKKRENPNWPL